MGNIQTAVVLIFVHTVLFFVPALVWVTLVVGLCQLVRDKIRESFLVRKMLLPTISKSSRIQPT